MKGLKTMEYIVLAQYSEKLNLVRERRVKSFPTWSKEGIDYINKNQSHAIMLYVDGCVTWENMSWGMIRTDAYKAEYLKIQD